MPFNALIGGVVMGVGFGLTTAYRHVMPSLYDLVSGQTTINRDRAEAYYKMRIDYAYRLYRRVNGGEPPFESRELPSWMPKQSPAATYKPSLNVFDLFGCCDQPRASKQAKQKQCEKKIEVDPNVGETLHTPSVKS